MKSIRPEEILRNLSKKQKVGGLVVIVILLGAIAFCAYLVLRPSPENELITITAEIQKSMILPSEEPVLATITDKKKLQQDQPFFKQAENGDKLLVYSQAKKVILFRPSIHKVVDVAPLIVDQQQAPVETTTPTPNPKAFSVAILNGTQTIGLAARAEKQLKQWMPNMTVVSKTSSKLNYTKTQIIDLKKADKETADQLAQILDGEVVAFPEGEDKPANADFLIIVGK